ncbi:MAG: phosphoglycerate mutase family protein [Micavibrio sp.]|nr:phosphoglycerate mutase family protein [Micavibrio sp.]
MIFFIRHGQTDANLKRINAGGGPGGDVPLNETGRAQARAFSAAHQVFIESIDHVFISPMIRAQQTAELILAGHNKTTDNLHDLREMELGEWEGVSYDISTDFFQNQVQPPGGESWLNFRTRSINALRHAGGKHQGNVLVIAHGGVWFSYAHITGHKELFIENCVRMDVCRVKLGQIILPNPDNGLS